MNKYIPQIFIVIFLVLMMFTAVWAGIPWAGLINDSLVRLVMNGVLVLSLIPMLNVGAGINYGLPVAISAGLLGMAIAVNYQLSGILGFFAAIMLSALVAIVFGLGYAGILNRVRGREEITGVFAGFSFIYVMSFFWAVAPFTNPGMLWPIGGYGMRPTIGLGPYFAKSLNELWSLHIGDVLIPLGMLSFFALIGVMLYLLFKTRIGSAILAVGENECFARLAGINISRTRSIAIIISTIIAAIGICVYAQSYGFLELYEAPLMMAFPAASAILLGGSSGRRTTVLQAFLGTFLFQSVYVYSGPLANALLLPEVSEIFRVMISNGIILYALLFEGGRTSSEKV